MRVPSSPFVTAGVTSSTGELLAEVPNSRCFSILSLFLRLRLMTTSGTLTDVLRLLLQGAGKPLESLARQESGSVTGARAKDAVSVPRLSLQ